MFTSNCVFPRSCFTYSTRSSRERIFFLKSGSAERVRVAMPQKRRRTVAHARAEPAIDRRVDIRLDLALRAAQAFAAASADPPEPAGEALPAVCVETRPAGEASLVGDTAAAEVFAQAHFDVLIEDLADRGAPCDSLQAPRVQLGTEESPALPPVGRQQACDDWSCAK